MCTVSVDPEPNVKSDPELDSHASSGVLATAEHKKRCIVSHHGSTSRTWERPVFQVGRDGGRRGPTRAPSGASGTERRWDSQQVGWRL